MVWLLPTTLWSRSSMRPLSYSTFLGWGPQRPGYGQICRSGVGEVGRVKILFFKQGLCCALPQGAHRAFPKPQPRTPAPPQPQASPCPSRRFYGPRPDARPPRTLLGPPAPALRSWETRCRCPAGARAAVRPNIDTKSAPPGTEFGGAGEGAQTSASPETPPAPLAAVAACVWGGYLVLSGPRGAHAATPLQWGLGVRWGPREASGRRNCFSGCPRRLGPGCSSERSSHCLRLSEARRRCSPSCRCHQPAEAGPVAGAGPELPRPSSGGKVERSGLRATVASPLAKENCRK